MNADADEPPGPERDDAPTGNQPAEPTASHETTEPAYVLVILPEQHITLPEMLTHIEAGRTIRLIHTPGNPSEPDTA